MNTTTGALVVGANIQITNGELVTNTAVGQGYTLTDVSYQFGPYDEQIETIETAEVIGFTIRPKTLVKRSTRIFDGVPQGDVEDPNGGAFWGTVDETSEIEAIVVKIPDPVDEEDEGAEQTYSSRKLYVSNIRALTATEPEETEENGDSGDDDPVADGDDNG